jgi:hypothetical protein
VNSLAWNHALEMSVFPEGLEPLTDLTPAAWVREALGEWPSRPFEVRDLVPPVFEAYARILHRPRNEDPGLLGTGTWAHQAAELGRELRPESTWWDLVGATPNERDLDAGAPQEGSLSEPEVATLAPLLATMTSDPAACWFALWSGFGFLGGGWEVLRPAGLGVIREKWTRRRDLRRQRRRRKEFDRLTTFELLGQSGRSYLLFGGAVEDAGRFTFSGWFQSPTLWWPEDRAWFIHTEIDGMSTYVGGTRGMVDRLVGEQILESFEVAADDRAAL